MVTRARAMCARVRVQADFLACLFWLYSDWQIKHHCVSEVMHACEVRDWLDLTILRVQTASLSEDWKISSSRHDKMKIRVVNLVLTDQLLMHFKRCTLLALRGSSCKIKFSFCSIYIDHYFKHLFLARLLKGTLRLINFYFCMKES